jgi:hypothetical protein
MSKFDRETESFARHCPKTWEVISGRRYILPLYRQADYANQVQLINEYTQYLADYCSGTMDHEDGKFDKDSKCAHLCNLALALARKRPTYYLERELGEKLMRVVLPDPLDPALIRWPVPQMRIMLPKNLLRAEFKTDRITPVHFLDIARYDADKRIAFPKELVRELALDPRISVNRFNSRMGSLENEAMNNTESGGLVTVSRLTHPEFPNEFSTFFTLQAWPLVDIQKLNQSICLDADLITEKNFKIFGERLRHLALNILLFLSSSPENFQLLEPIRAPKTKGKRFISGLYPAKFVGDSQRVKVRHEPNVIASKPTKPGSAHAAHWVAGHWRHQLIGPRESPSTKLVLIYPYFAEGNKESNETETLNP